MPVLPAFYVDNVQLVHSSTTTVRGNVVSDITANNATGIRIVNCNTLRAKNNKVFRLKSPTGNAIGFQINNCDDALLLYNVASRCDLGFDFSSITTFNVYNLTSHACTTHIRSSSNGTFRNIALTAYRGHKTYFNCTGFDLTATINVDYMRYYGIRPLSSGGTLTEGSNVVEETQPILYIDEANDNLTPDHISILVNSGTDNPLRIEDPCIGGIESEITDEVTADRKYHYDLLDNSFWDIDNDDAAEVHFIKAYQSRIAANTEAAEHSVERNMYVKSAESTLRFSELYPMYARYTNQTKFKKRVGDMWYSGQNPGTIAAYNNAIGGYNLFPSFFKRLEDVDDFWIINVSYVDIDNWLLGMDAQRYGILIDVLGTSTLSQAASAECYNNTMKSVADIAPVYWNLHNEPQPPNYLLFTDLYNNFEDCTLNNMIYNDDFNVSPDVVQQDCACLTPLIPTATVTASGNTVEFSILDRIWSETITRRIFYRQGNNSSSMGSWTEITKPIGETLVVSAPYIQFRITATEILRQIDYEFLGICLRPYTSARIWTQPNI